MGVHFLGCAEFWRGGFVVSPARVGGECVVGSESGRCIYVSIVLILLVFWRFFAFLGETYG